jgi:hypothetical protein
MDLWSFNNIDFNLDCFRKVIIPKANRAPSRIKGPTNRTNPARSAQSPTSRVLIIVLCGRSISDYKDLDHQRLEHLLQIYAAKAP